MKKHLEDKLSMALATEQVMNDNTTLWNSIPAMVTAMTTLGTKIASIHGVRNVQEQDIRGVALDKEAKKRDAIEKALIVIGGLKAFAIASGDNTLLKKINYSESELDKCRDTICADRLKIVRDEANTNLSALAPYNVTSTEVNALSTAIASYEVMIPKTRVALNVRKNSTDALELLMQELDSPLKIMDGLVETLQLTQPAFSETYNNARIIVDSSSGGSGVKGTVSDKTTGAPLVGVKVSINAPQHRARVNSITPTRTMTSTTNEHGNYEIRRIPPGSYTLTMELEGYNTLKIQVTIEEGNVTDADGKMERVTTPSA